jgi:predicted Zn-dependent protease
LLLAADEEDQVAGVMAHEIAHVAARHWASQITKATLLQYGMIPLIVTPMSYPVYEGASQALNLGVPLTFLKFSRSAEAEADYLGLQYMFKAGYDPNSYTAFFGKILQEERRAPGSVPRLFLDHPPTAERIMKSEEEIKEILPKREQYLVSTSEFDDVKERLRAVISKRFERGGPTLERLEDTADPATQTQAGSQRKEQGDGTDDKPPVLQRRQ